MCCVACWITRQEHGGRPARALYRRGRTPRGGRRTLALLRGRYGVASTESLASCSLLRAGGSQPTKRLRRQRPEPESGEASSGADGRTIGRRAIRAGVHLTVTLRFPSRRTAGAGRRPRCGGSAGGSRVLLAEDVAENAENVIDLWSWRSGDRPRGKRPDRSGAVERSADWYMTPSSWYADLPSWTG
jgi:hypothetical protein